MEDRAHALPKNCPVNSALSKTVVSEREKAAMDEGERERGDLMLTEGIRNPCTYSYQRYDDFSLTIASTERG